MADRSSDRARRRRGGQQGQVLPVVATLLVVVAVLALGVVAVARAATERARAQAAADATALAGAQEGRAGAVTVARANDASLVAFRLVGDDVAVVVRRHGVVARARAGPRLDP